MKPTWQSVVELISGQFAPGRRPQLRGGSCGGRYEVRGDLFYSTVGNKGVSPDLLGVYLVGHNVILLSRSVARVATLLTPPSGAFSRLGDFTWDFITVILPLVRSFMMHKLSTLALVAVLRSQFLFQGKSCFGYKHAPVFYATVPVLKQPLLLTIEDLATLRDTVPYAKKSTPHPTQLSMPRQALASPTF